MTSLFPVHKCVIAQKSGFFRTLCSGPFQEAQKHEITLHDDNPYQVARMVCWMHYDQYPCGRFTKLTATPEVTVDKILKVAFGVKDIEVVNDLFRQKLDHAVVLPQDVSLYLMADKYDVPDLQRRCVPELINSLEKGFDLEGFWRILDFIKETTVDTELLKDGLCVYLVANLGRYVYDVRFYELIEHLPHFAWMLLRGINHEKSIQEALRPP